MQSYIFFRALAIVDKESFEDSRTMDILSVKRLGDPLVVGHEFRKLIESYK